MGWHIVQLEDTREAHAAAPSNRCANNLARSVLTKRLTKLSDDLLKTAKVEPALTSEAAKASPPRRPLPRLRPRSLRPAPRRRPADQPDERESARLINGHRGSGSRWPFRFQDLFERGFVEDGDTQRLGLGQLGTGIRAHDQDSWSSWTRCPTPWRRVHAAHPRRRRAARPASVPVITKVSPLSGSSSRPGRRRSCPSGCRVRPARRPPCSPGIARKNFAISATPPVPRPASLRLVRVACRSGLRDRRTAPPARAPWTHPPAECPARTGIAAASCFLLFSMAVKRLAADFSPSAVRRLALFRSAATNLARRVRLVSVYRSAGVLEAGHRRPVVR